MPKSLVRRSLQGYQPYIPGEQPPDAEGWIKLNTNEAPLPPSPRVLAAIKAAADESLRLYPGADPARLKFIVNPNSPTGALFERDEVEAVVAASSGVVVIDEAYVDFAPVSCLPLLDRYANVLLLRTFSKSYALAGMRIGFALGPAELIEALDSVKDSYNVDRLAIVAAVAAIEDEDHHRRIVDEVVDNRESLARSLEGLGFELVPSSTNFVFGRPPRPAHEVVAALRERKILVRHYDREPIAGWLRITVGTPGQHEQLLSALKEIL
jgi:histidinol-phosphate aminotransferase